MACFDLQHQYRVQPLFCWQFTGCTARSCYTGSGALITACTTARPPGAFLESPPPPSLDFRSPLHPLTTTTTRHKCPAGLFFSFLLFFAYCWGMFGDRVAWKIICAWLIPFSLYMELPGGDSPHSYWHFDPMHNPEILVPITYVLLHSR